MTKKYRPYLSLPMMERIITLVQDKGTNLTSTDVAIQESLEIMILKARHEITKPSYVPISGRLGMNVPVNEQTGPSYRYHSNLMTPEEREAYEQSLQDDILKGLS